MPSSTSSSEAPRRRLRLSDLPWAFLVTAALAVLIEAGVYFFAPPADQRDMTKYRFYNIDPTPMESIIQWQMYHLQHSIPGPQDLILIGSSSCLMGLDTNQFIKRTGLQAWNLGTVGWLGTTGHAEILEKYIDLYGPPRYVVYNAAPFFLTRSGEDIERIGFLRHLRRWLGWDGEKPDPWPPSARFRREVGPARRALYTALEGSRDPLLTLNHWGFPSDSEIRRILLEKRGFLKRTDGRGLAGKEEWRPEFADFEPGFRKLFDLADRYGFKVLVVLNPLPESYRTEATDKSLAGLEKRFEKLVDGNDRVSLFTPFTRYYPVSLCSDERHLREAGAERNSAEILRWMKEHWGL